MAIVLLNEFEYTGAQGVSKLISPFMKPCLYFKVEGDGSITTPEAVLTINGTTDDYDFDCTYLGLNADNDYLFHLDLSDIIKYLMRNFDGTLKPDDLDMVATHGLTLFDEYFLDWSAGTIATLYFEKGTINEVTEALEPTFIYLSGQLPRASGFNLYDVLFNENLLPLKWSANTYNALFLWLRAGTVIITNITNSSFHRVLFNDTVAAEGYYQYKFPKYSTDIALYKGFNTIMVQNTGMSAVFIQIDYDPDCQYVDVLFQHPLLGYVSFPFNGASVESISFKKGDEFDKFLTTLVNISELKEITGYEGQKRIAITGKVDSQYWPVTQELHGSRHVYLYAGERSVPENYITSWVNVDFTSFTSALNAITSAVAAASLKYALSNAFNITSGDVFLVCLYLVKNSGADPLILLVDHTVTTISNVETLSAGLNFIVLTATAADTSGKVRIASNGAVDFYTSGVHIMKKSEVDARIDTAINWIKCEVAGGSSFRSNRSREEVNVELMLPEHFNIKF